MPSFTIDTGIQVYFCDPNHPGRGDRTRTPTARYASTPQRQRHVPAHPTRPRPRSTPTQRTASTSLNWMHHHRNSPKRCSDPRKPLPIWGGMVAWSPPPAGRLGSLNPRVGGLVDDDGHESLCEPVSQGLGGKRWVAVGIWAFGFQ